MKKKANKPASTNKPVSNGMARKALGAAAMTARVLNPLPTDAVSGVSERFNRVSGMWSAYRELSGKANTKRRNLNGQYGGVALAFERCGRALAWLPLIGPVLNRLLIRLGSMVGGIVQWIDKASVTTITASVLQWLMVIGAALMCVGVLLTVRDGFTATTVGVSFAGIVVFVRHALLLLTLNIKAKQIQHNLSNNVV